ncbi:hypothetical protein BOTBODRAFT_564383 [Botryobasidium botryosum FD-172 SS1]|uniref:G domain-containing protein n=1 Tax=Botryobasidium botryosum (strain FD-172 SS1) TaxID=930990 RepID=A0A067LZ60_BOTB1|nr:hypothetical protein BOTBODRAFT_564383 [Botryobasidium botryosum FD-172 SS1]
MPPSFLRWPSLFGTKRSDSNANSNQDQPYRFRILIIGRANAGKTTILRAVCGAEGEPDVYDHEGNLVVLGAAHEAQGQLMSDIHKDDKPARKSTSSIIRSLRDRIAHKASKSSSSAPRSTRALSSILSPSALRGEHNIEYSLLFPSNRRFIFHDSRGFESGSTDELEVVRNFIEKHASEGSMKKQLHAIWSEYKHAMLTIYLAHIFPRYCFPADSNRIITAAEQEFFSSIDTGRVPVVAIFTKFDALDAAACGEFCAQGVPLDKAQRRAPQLAHDKFKQNVLPLISSQPHSPKAVVCLRNMHKMPFSSITEATTELIEKTVVSLDDDVLKQLLIQVQHINVELCIKAAVNSGIIGKTAQGSIQKGIAAADPLQQDMVEEIFKWFPYIWTFVSITVFTPVIG